MANKKGMRATPVKPGQQQIKKTQETKKAQTGKETAVQKPEASKGISLAWKLALALAVVCFVIYFNTVKNGYVLDDSSSISENKLVQKGISAIPELLSTPFRYGFYATENDLYRPLSLVTLAIEYQFFGLNPGPEHFINIVVFACCVIALFFFLNNFFNKKRTGVAFLASLLFALHPIHTEVVANIKSLDELLCFLFAFLSLSACLKYVQTGKAAYLLLGGLLYFISYLSKETVVAFLAVYPLVFFFYHNESKRRAVMISLMSVVVTGLFLYIRFSVLREYNADHMASIAYIDNALVSQSLTTESLLATAMLIMGTYIKLLIFPYPLSSDYSPTSIPFVHFTNPLVLLSVGAYIFLAVFALYRLFKKNKDPYAFAILFFLITIALFSNIPFRIGATMGERFMFYGSVGFCLAAALLIDRLAGATTEITKLKKPKILAVVIPVALIYAGLTINRNTDWHSNYSLYKADIAKYPTSAKLNFMYGLELEKTIAPEEKDPAKQKEIRREGMTYLRHAVTTDTSFAEGFSNLGNAYAYLGMPDSGIYFEEKAHRMFPAHQMTVNNLAVLYYTAKEYRKSIPLSLEALILNPEQTSAYTNLGLNYLALGKADSSFYYTRKAIAQNPDYHFAYIIMAHLFQMTGQADSMNKYIAIEQKYNPNFKMQ